MLFESGQNGESNLFQIAYDELEFEKIVWRPLKSFVNKYRDMNESAFKALIKKYPFL